MGNTRTVRILSLFHIFYFCNHLALDDIRKYLPGDEVSKKTLFRYIRFLKDAGLIQLWYSQTEKAYIPTDNCHFVPQDGAFYPPKLPDKKSQRLYMKKIIRLCTLMIKVMEWEYWGENAPIDWYRKMYPELSDRTRQRDFEQLREIGYCITYFSGDENTPAGYEYTYPYDDEF